LVPQAAGSSYRDIEAETGWTSTKVNLALTEGRAALRERLAAIDEGTDCPRHAHHLPAVARGVAPADELVPLRAHLRARGACRAHLADLREQRPPSVRSLGHRDPTPGSTTAKIWLRVYVGVTNASQAEAEQTTILERAAHGRSP
ncbi:MAG: hypothetical protein ACJ76G_06870, partial [Solirubrobacterales bacterium]